jgi:hypothetical protein
VDAQANISLPNAQNIVSQLVDIAKANNAMDVIGNSTSWRWQEGLISRMPKTRTVAAILTKAFRTDDPRDWLVKVPNDLKWFIKTNILKDEAYDAITSLEVDDIYEAYYLTIWSTGGASREEVIFGFCYFRYASTMDCKIEQYEAPSFDKVKALYGSWAEQKYNECVIRFDLESTERKSQKPWSLFFNNESFTRRSAELAILRNKIVGFSSIYDMWKFSSFRVTDSEHIEIELEIKAFYEGLRAKYATKTDKPLGEKSKLRTYAFSAITFPSVGEEAK